MRRAAAVLQAIDELGRIARWEARDIAQAARVTLAEIRIAADATERDLARMDAVYGAELRRYAEDRRERSGSVVGAERARRDAEILARLAGGGMEDAAAALRGDRTDQDHRTIRLQKRQSDRDREYYAGIALKWRQRAREYRSRLIASGVVFLLRVAAMLGFFAAVLFLTLALGS